MSNLTPEQWHHRRKRAERRFRLYGMLGLGVAVALLVLLLGIIIARGIQGFTQTQIQ
jgi:phosphate transport system permease protein